MRWTTPASSARWAIFWQILPVGESVVPLLGDLTYDADALTARANELDVWVRRWHATREPNDTHANRRARMHAVNPRFIFRNYLAQEAIELAESGDPSMIHTLLEVLRHPYDEQPASDRFAARRPDWARNESRLLDVVVQLVAG
ncbi:MAG: hypothetical protein HC937_02555 [Aquincola sp.]|nr:hypothetical protein [Aquincola sp.]